MCKNDIFNHLILITTSITTCFQH